MTDEGYLTYGLISSNLPRVRVSEKVRIPSTLGDKLRGADDSNGANSRKEITESVGVKEGKRNSAARGGVKEEEPNSGTVK